MARRKGRKGEHLVTDDYTGFTTYVSKVRKDYWGAYAVNPLKRNLQEIATPLNDPHPVEIYRGPNYEITPNCVAELAPTYVGLTNVPTNPNNAAFQVFNLSPSIPDMAISCTFIVR